MVGQPENEDTNDDGARPAGSPRRSGAAGAGPVGAGPAGAGRVTVGGDGDGDLTRFAASSRTREAVRARSREHGLRQQLVELTTLAGACRSLAEAGQPLGVTTVVGRTHHGRVRSLGDDFLSLVVGGDREVVVPFDAVAVLEAGRGDGPTGAAPLPGATFAEAVALLAADRPVVTVWCRGSAAPIVGELLGASAELALIGPRRGERRGVAYVRLSAVAELSVSASG